MKILLLLFVVLISACSKTENSNVSSDAKMPQGEYVSELYHLTDGGKSVGALAGSVTIMPALTGGTSFHVEVSGVTPGEHGFHIHEFPYLTMPESGNHWDPDNTGSHKGPYATNGHRGDLPFLTANSSGVINETVIAPNVEYNDLMNHSLMIHEGGDNYTDSPPNGGGGGRMIAGVIKPGGSGSTNQ